MAADIFALVNQLSVLLAARRPQWVRQTMPAGGYVGGTTDDPPTGVGSGVYLQDSPRSILIIDLRRDPAFRTVKLTIRVLDLTATYRVTIAGTNVDYDALGAGAASEADVIEGWRDAINAANPPNNLVTARAEDSTGGGGAVDTLVIEGDTVDGWAFGVSCTVGAAEVDAIADTATAQARVWFAAKSINASNPTVGWRIANGALYPITRRGFAERFDVAGLDRCHVELTAHAGNTDVGTVAPCTLKYWSEITHGPAVLEVT